MLQYIYYRYLLLQSLSQLSTYEQIVTTSITDKRHFNSKNNNICIQLMEIQTQRLATQQLQQEYLAKLKHQRIKFQAIGREYQERCKEIASQNEQIQHLGRELCSIKENENKMEVVFAERQGALKKRISRLEEQLDRTSTQLMFSKQSDKESSQQLSECKLQVSQLSIQRENMQKALNQLSNRCELTQEENDNLTVTLKGCKKRLHEVVEELDCLKISCKRKEGELKKCTCQLNLVQRDLEQANNQLTSEKKKHFEKDRRIKQLQKQCKDAQLELGMVTKKGSEPFHNNEKAIEAEMFRMEAIKSRAQLSQLQDQYKLLNSKLMCQINDIRELALEEARQSSFQIEALKKRVLAAEEHAKSMELELKFQQEMRVKSEQSVRELKLMHGIPFKGIF